MICTYISELSDYYRHANIKVFKSSGKFYSHSYLCSFLVLIKETH